MSLSTAEKLLIKVEQNDRDGYLYDGPIRKEVQSFLETLKTDQDLTGKTVEELDKKIEERFMDEPRLQTQIVGYCEPRYKGEPKSQRAILELIEKSILRLHDGNY